MRISSVFVRSNLRAFNVLSVLVLLFGVTKVSTAAQQRPIDVISDNSFLLEEAYNQEPRTIQHIFTARHNNDSRQRGWEFAFTQEWPIFSQDHQFSYSIPSFHIREDGDRIYGVGDLRLNYRYQALEEGDVNPAFAPRLTLITPTGSRRKQTGAGVVGYELELPFSKKVGSHAAVHANFGLMALPKVRVPLSDAGSRLSPKRSLVSYHAGAGLVYAISERLHFLLEWFGEFEQSLDNNGRRERSFKPLLAPGFRTAVVNQEDFQIVLGAAAPIGLNRHADNYGAFLYFSLEHGF